MMASQSSCTVSNLVHEYYTILYPSLHTEELKEQFIEINILEQDQGETMTVELACSIFNDISHQKLESVVSMLQDYKATLIKSESAVIIATLEARHVFRVKLGELGILMQQESIMELDDYTMANKTFLIGEMRMIPENSLTELISLLNAMRLAMPFLGLRLSLFQDAEEIPIFQHSPTFVKSPEDIIQMHYQCESVFHAQQESKFGELQCTVAIVNQRVEVDGRNKIYSIKHSNGRIRKQQDWSQCVIHKISESTLKAACGISLESLSEEECFYPVYKFRQGRRTKKPKVCYDLFIIFNENTIGGKSFEVAAEKRLLLQCLRNLKSRTKKHLLSNPELDDSYKYSEAISQFGDIFASMLRMRHSEEQLAQNLEEIVAQKTRAMFSRT